MAFVLRKRLRRNFKRVLFGIVLLFGVAAVYHEMITTKPWSVVPISSVEENIWRLSLSNKRVVLEKLPDYAEDVADWRSNFTPQDWNPENKGRANLHVFEDWCGGSVAGLRKNIHYPLHPHTRTTVRKLTVSPQWTNYGLRIFGYLHPYADGEFVFAVSSDDNSEFWLSANDSPHNAQLVASVGKTGAEWTAPGEFTKFASQTSEPVWLSAQKRYFFEILHKQDDKGTDHVEVAWKLVSNSTEFTIIESSHISLYADESALQLGDVAHIPQTAASHQSTPTKQQDDTVDMKKEDPRDTFYRVPLINSAFLRGVLPDCTYKPTYTIKGQPLERYQGLQYVHLSYVYPNDYTRLTHMERQDSCFYHRNHHYLRRLGFSRYMKLDSADAQGNSARDPVFPWSNLMQHEKNQRSKSETGQDRMDRAVFPDYGDDFDDYAQDRRRKLFSIVPEETNEAEFQPVTAGGDDIQRPQLKAQKPVRRLLPVNAKHVQQKTSGQTADGRDDLQVPPSNSSTHRQVHQGGKKHLQAKLPAVTLSQPRGSKPGQKLRAAKKKLTRIKKRKGSKLQSLGKNVAPAKKPTVAKQKPLKGVEQVTTHVAAQPQSPEPSHREAHVVEQLSDKEPETPLHQESEKSTPGMFTTSEGRTDSPPPTPTPEESPKRQEEGNHEEDNHEEDNREEANRDEAHREEAHREDNREEAHREEAHREEAHREEAHREEDNREESNREDSNREEDNREEDNREEDNREEDNREEASQANSQRPQRDTLEDLENTEYIDNTAAPVFVEEINWSQTFDVDHLDFQEQRSDWIDLHCNISGNLLLQAGETLPLVQAFMDRLHKKHPGRLSLVRVVNVEKRLDSIKGSRYLLELEVKDDNGRLLRLSHYIYALQSYSRYRSQDHSDQLAQAQQVLCNPVGFKWNPAATVHIIVPVRNQARWVHQLISDMERVFQLTGDTNFNLIITDYSSTDIDVKKALQSSTLPRYQYLKLSGPFQRSAGLQAGVNLVKDQHSILFLCDLHIEFPDFIIDNVRKHTVEGHMVFAPIVMRLGCGSTSQDATGFWEVNGFGLLSIYKSDLDAVGGMNTKEYTNSWGGEDWELIDRIFQAGLEVERLYLRNFFHYYHSKRGMWNQQMVSKQR